MIRAVFFDVGGTLIHPWPSVGAVYAGVGEKFGIHETPHGMEQRFRLAWEDSKRGGRTTSDKEWWRKLVRRATGTDFSDEYFEALYDAFAQPNVWRVFPDVFDTLAACRARRLHVGIISNWDERLRPLLDRLGLIGQFDSLTISCEVGAEKPSAAIFETALRAGGTSAGEALHVGDSATEDRQGAQAVGMNALLVRQSPADGLATLGAW